MGAAPDRYEVNRVPIAESVSTDLVSSPTVIFDVVGFDPRVRVAVEVYFQFRDATDTEPAGANVWSAAPCGEDDNGSRRPLANIFTSKALPDGAEFSSGADCVRFTCSFVRTGELGFWMVHVYVKPQPGLDPCLFEQLAKQVKLDPPGRVASVSMDT